jgi:hypothetical protein
LKKEWEQFQELDRLEVQLQKCRALGAWAVHSDSKERLEQEMRVSFDPKSFVLTISGVFF